MEEVNGLLTIWYMVWGVAHVQTMDTRLPPHSKSRNVVVTKSMLFQFNVGHCELLTNVVYDNFQDIPVPIQCSREYKKFQASPCISTVHSCK